MSERVNMLLLHCLSNAKILSVADIMMADGSA